IGLLWLTQVLWKPPSDFGSKGPCPTSLKAQHLSGLCDWMHREATHTLNVTLISKKYLHFDLHFSTDLYAKFVQNTVLPHYSLFGWMTFVTESALAISLLLGLFTRLGGLVGALWALNLTIGLWSVPGEWYWTYLMLAALNLIFFATCAGRYFGLDALLTRL